MARKISTSPLVDQPMLGSFNITTNTLSTLGSNENIIIDPNGTGLIEFDGDVQIRNQGDLRLLESSSNGTNYIAMQAAANMASNYTITWPAAVGSASTFLSTDASGNLSWVSAGAGIAVADPGAVATVYYPFFGTNAGAVPTAFGPNARSNLSFVPSTGALTSTEGFFGTITGGTGSGSNLTLRSSTNATKGQVFIDESTASTSTTSGALRVAGGVGVAGQVTCGTLSATTITETSSIALKENINPITNALDKILQLQAYIYDRKDGSSYNESGLIAEYVNRVLPDLVSLDEQGKPYGIKYTKLTAYLLESIKELHAELQNLKR